MSKTIEEIKLEIANEKGRVSWGHLIQFTTSKWKDEYFTEVAQRYAQSQRQELQEQNAELVRMLEKSLGALNDCCMVIDSEDEVFEYIKNLSVDITKVLFNYRTKINVK